MGSLTVITMSIVLIFSLCIFSYIHAQLEVKACCGSDTRSCRAFERVDELLGIACCGNYPYNTFTQICCENEIRERYQGGSSYTDLCCGNNVLGHHQTCCNGTVHNIANADCCGNEAYVKTDSTFLCCNEKLIRTTSSTDVCCGSSAFDGGRQHICCGNKVFKRTEADSCCMDNNGTIVEYHSKTHFCCNGAVPRASGRGCCYLQLNGTFIADSYDIETECCRYPYDSILSKHSGDCDDKTNNTSFSSTTLR